MGIAESLVQKPAVEGLTPIWGERTDVRRTLGTPERTRVLAALDYFISKFPHREDVKALRKMLPHAWAGELGWDTDNLIRAVHAATATMTVPQHDQRPNNGDQP